MMPDDDWPDFDCPRCGSKVWHNGFEDVTTVPGQGEYRDVNHCGVCELVVIRGV